MRTYALLEVSEETYQDIHNRIKNAGNPGDYDDLFGESGEIRMDGIALMKEKKFK